MNGHSDRGSTPLRSIRTLFFGVPGKIAPASRIFLLLKLNDIDIFGICDSVQNGGCILTGTALTELFGSIFRGKKQNTENERAEVYMQASARFFDFEKTCENDGDMVE